MIFSFFFFNDTATTEIYTLSLHDALPIYLFGGKVMRFSDLERAIPNITQKMLGQQLRCQDRKSTRLNSSHGYISYAVFCLKKKKIHQRRPIVRAKRYREQFRHVKRRRDHK